MWKKAAMMLMEVPFWYMSGRVYNYYKTTDWIVGVSVEIRRTYLPYASQKRYRLITFLDDVTLHNCNVHKRKNTVW